MTRRILSVRQLARVLADPAGLRFVVTRALPADGETLEPGADVTERAKAWSEGVLRTHVKRGYLAVVRDPSSAKRKTSALEGLYALGTGTKKQAIKDALEAAGVSVPSGATKDELLLLRAAAIASVSP
jgi:hypothetical protein